LSHLRIYWGSGSNDSFTLAGEGQVDGTIDGGGGTNILDFSTISSPVAVDLADVSVGPTTGAAGVLNINEVKGGSGASDVLRGPDASDVIWDITGKNSGTVGTVIFSGFENLQGADDVNDGFLLNVDGEITGSVDGGGGSGIDGLAIQNPDAANAPPTLIMTSAVSLNGSLSAGVVFTGVPAVSYEGLERPLTLVQIEDSEDEFNSGFK